MYICIYLPKFSHPCEGLRARFGPIFHDPTPSMKRGRESPVGTLDAADYECDFW